MPISWNEIRHRAIAFTKNWAGETREDAEKQTFWNEFFDVFGVSRRAVASFNEPVKNVRGHYSYIVKAHADPGRAFDHCYRPQPFDSER